MKRRPEENWQLLERALRLYVNWSAAPRRESKQELLSRHPELVDYLQPMLDGAGERKARGIGEQRVVPLTKEQSESPATTDGPSKTLGPYKILSELGAGGMGTVYRAEQTAPVRRQVAVKQLHPERTSPTMLARFAHERQALASMQHPGIAMFLDAGLTPGGDAYFVMEYVHGAPIDLYCDTEHMDLDSRVRLLIKVCQAVQHAHQKGVIHCDLKPSNILVTVVDGAPLPKIIDFGVSRWVETVLRESSGCSAGTAEYMSPEQADTEANDIDTRSDIFALGVIAFELLVGKMPYAAQLSKTKELAELAPEIRNRRTLSAPELLSRLSQSELSDIAHLRSTTPRVLKRRLSGDLTTILAKATIANRNGRYASIAELVADLSRHLRHEPVSARPSSVSYVVRCFVAKHKALCTVVLLTAAAISTGLAVTLPLYFAAAAATARQEMNTYVSVIAGVQAQLKDDPRGANVLLETAPEALRKWEWFFLKSRLTPALHTLEQQPGVTRLSAHGGRLVAECPTKLAVWKCNALAVAPSYQQLVGERFELGICERVVALAPDGRKLVLVLRKATEPSLTLAVYNQAKSVCDSLATIADASPLRVEGSFSLDSSFVCVSYVNQKPGGYSTVSVFSLQGGKPNEVKSLEGVTTFVFDHTGTRLIVGDKTSIRALSLLGGDETLLYVLDGDAPKSLCLSADGSALGILASQSTTVLRLGGSRAGSGVLQLPRVAQTLALAPDGKRAVTSGLDGQVSIWSLDDEATHERTFLAHSRGVAALTFVEDETRFASAGQVEGEVRIWSTEELQSNKPVPKSRFSALHPSGTELAVISEGRLCVVNTAFPTPPMRHRDPDVSAASICYSPDGASTYIGSQDGRIYNWNAQTSQLIEVLQCRVTDVARKVNPQQEIHESVMDLAIDESADRMLVVRHQSNGHAVTVWNLKSGQEGTEVRFVQGTRPHASFLMGQRDILIGNSEGLEIVSPDLRILRRKLNLFGNVYQSSPDGRAVVGVNSAGDLELWSLRNGKLLATGARVGQLRSVAYLPDGTRIIVATATGDVQILDAQSLHVLLTLLRGSDPVGVHVSANGERIFCVERAERFHDWDLRPRAEVAQEMNKAAEQLQFAKNLVAALVERKITLEKARAELLSSEWSVEIKKRALDELHKALRR
ncbi:MAG: protein kinase domain-containing protein [Planctomycetota bacterium]